MTELIEIVEIDTKYCQHTYGVSPCTAQLGVTGESKCFNTRNIVSDCQSKPNFLAETKTYRFGNKTPALPKDQNIIASLKSLSVSSPMLAPSESIGQRMTARITFQNHPHGDDGIDKYVDDRDYDPYEVGTFWGKFRARNPYLKGMPIRIYRGSSDEEFSQYELTNLIVDDFVGPDIGGMFTISAVDIFRFLDNDKAMAPVLSQGELFTNITSTQTSADLSPPGIGDTYPSSGLLRIGKEVVSFTRSGDSLSIQRGQKNTKAEDHQAEDICQLVLTYDSLSFDAILFDLITNYTNLDATNIDLAQWQIESQDYNSALYSSTITTPTPVKKLINELIEQTGIVMWPDTSNNMIELQVVRPVPSDARLIDDDVILSGTLKVKDQQEKRVDNVWTYFNQRDPTEKQDDENNYFSAKVDIGQNSDQYEQDAIRQIFSRWIPPFSKSIASAINGRILSRFEIPPRKIAFQVYRDQKLKLAQNINVCSWSIEKCDGSKDVIPAQIVALSRVDDKINVVAEELRFTAQSSLTQKILIVDTDTQDLNLRSAYDATYGSLDPNEKVTVYIESTADVGSTSSGIPALTVGSWPSGVSIELIVYGRIIGKGGDGGTISSKNGKNGGIAILATRDITLFNFGSVWGGGGGAYATDVVDTTIDGGGGAGFSPGQGSSPSATRSTGGGGGGGIGSIKGGDPGQDGPDGEGKTGGNAGFAISGGDFVDIATNLDMLGDIIP